MIPRNLALAAAAALALVHGHVAAQTIRAHLDRNPISADETVRLIVEADFQAGSVQPDIATLQRDFEVLGQTTSTHVAIENGSRRVRTEWTIELAPRRSGRLPIGPLKVGSMTSPAIELEVLPSSSTASQSARDVFLEVEVTPREVYVQSQIVCVLRIYRAAEFLDAKLSDFNPDVAVTYRLGKDSTYAKIVDGRRYRVIERRFAVFPQASGSLALPAFRLDARVAESGAASTMGRLFGEGRRVRLATQPVDVMVTPRPDAAPTPWLPARAVTLSEEWPDDPPRLVAGEPVTWTLRLAATGVAGEQLPEIMPPDLQGARVYPDQPSISTRAGIHAVHGERVQRVAMVPGTAGTMTIPELQVAWWDVEADAPRIARIPERTIAVAPAPTAAAAPRPSLAEPPSAPETSPRPWQFASAALALAWLATLGAYVRALRRRRGAGPHSTDDTTSEPSPDIATARRRALEACRGTDPRAARDALLGWAALVWSESPPRDLIALAARIGEQPPSEEILALDRALWSARAERWSGESLADRLPRNLGPEPSPRRPGTPSRLPSLHPA